METSNHQLIPELLLINANVITFNPLQPRVNWVALGSGRILRAGNSDQLAFADFSGSEIIDCGGGTILPGFIDSHLHLLSFAESLVTLNLKPDRGIRSLADIQSKIHGLSEKTPLGTWIRGKGYHEFDLAEKRHPNRWDLDDATSNHPVKLTHRSGHAHALNSLALKLAGITMETPEPPGGIIERDLETGIPTGLLYEMGDFLSARIPPLEDLELEKGIKMADQELISCGITTVQDASSQNDIQRWNMLRSWKKRGIFNPRINMMLGARSFTGNGLDEISSPVDPNQIQVRGVKIVLDETTGRLHPTQSRLDELVLRAHASGMQVAIHAIEENAIGSACQAIKNAVMQFPRSDHRHRIEHCSVCPPSLAKQIAALGIRVVTQPTFIYSNGDRYLETVEDIQLKHLYPIRSLFKAGIRPAGGSDCPIAPPNPLIAISTAISRSSENGKTVNRDEGLEAATALKMYTEYGAEASFSEKTKGSISPGKLADLVVLNGDPLTLPPDEIMDIKVLMTIINGRVVWDQGS